MVLPTRLEKLMVRKTPDLRHYTAFKLLLLSSGEANGGQRGVAVGSGEGSRVLDLARTVPDLMRKTPDLSRRTPFDEVTDLLLWIQRCSGGRWLPAPNLGKVKNLEFFSFKKKKNGLA